MDVFPSSLDLLGGREGRYSSFLKTRLVKKWEVLAVSSLRVRGEKKESFPLALSPERVDFLMQNRREDEGKRGKGEVSEPLRVPKEGELQHIYARLRARWERKDGWLSISTVFRRRRGELKGAPPNSSHGCDRWRRKKL